MTRNSRSSVERICSEAELFLLAKEIAEDLLMGAGSSRDLPRVLLYGAMGSGKSTFARAFLEALGVDRAAEGSPTFAIAHEYLSESGARVVHADGYRLKNDAELEETGLLEPLWDARVLILFEWMDLFPETKSALESSNLSVYEIHLHFVTGEEKLRRVELKQRER